MPKIEVKQIFDFDIVAGLIVAFIVDYIWAYLALRVSATAFLSTPIWKDFHYDDLLVLVTDVVVAWITKGKIRKIFIYAFWFNLAFEFYEILKGYTGYV